MPNDIIVTKFRVQFGSYQCECDAQKNTHNKNLHALMLKYENLMSLATSSRTFAHAFVSLKRINLRQYNAYSPINAFFVCANNKKTENGHTS